MRLVFCPAIANPPSTVRREEGEKLGLRVNLWIRICQSGQRPVDGMSVVSILTSLSRFDEDHVLISVGASSVPLLVCTLTVPNCVSSDFNLDFHVSPSSSLRARVLSGASCWIN